MEYELAASQIDSARRTVTMLVDLIVFGNLWQSTGNQERGLKTKLYELGSNPSATGPESGTG
jgi:hypothetical protein